MKRYSYVLQPQEGLVGVGPFAEVNALNEYARRSGMGPDRFTILIVEQPDYSKPQTPALAGGTA